MTVIYVQGSWLSIMHVMAAMSPGSHEQLLNRGRGWQVKELGRGQFGSVWLARWLGVDVAVKELHSMSDAKSNAEMIKVGTLDCH